MTIAKFPTVVIDCPDARVLADFYGELLGWQVHGDAEWAEVRSDGHGICFQQVANYRAPRWPGQKVPQQSHLDLIVDSLDDAEPSVLALGATRAEHQPGTSFRVFLDPAGHLFCLCVS